MTDDLPLSPEQWADRIKESVIESGHGDEVIVAIESTMSGWRVSVNPVRNSPTIPAPDAS